MCWKLNWKLKADLILVVVSKSISIFTAYSSGLINFWEKLGSPMEIFFLKVPIQKSKNVRKIFGNQPVWKCERFCEIERFCESESVKDFW